MPATTRPGANTTAGAAQRRDAGARPRSHAHRTTLIAAMLLRRGDVDRHAVRHLRSFLRPSQLCAPGDRPAPGGADLGTMNMLIVGGRQIFVCDTYVNRDPSPEQLAELTLLAAEEMRRFGLTPTSPCSRIRALAASTHPSAQKMRDALSLIQDGGSGPGGRRRDARRCGAIKAGARSRLPGSRPDDGSQSS